MRTPPTQSLRERKKAQTRRIIQQEALRLFLANGYESTTVEEIAAAAGISHMTFYRNFPTKEDVVLSDDYDPMIVELISARPANEPLMDRIRHAVTDGLAQIYAVDRDALLTRMRLILTTPALRARQWEQQNATEHLIARALSARAGESYLSTRVVAAACLAAISTAAWIWVEGNGEQDFPDLVDQAFTLLSRELGARNG